MWLSFVRNEGAEGYPSFEGVTFDLPVCAPNGRPLRRLRRHRRHVDNVLNEAGGGSAQRLRRRPFLASAVASLSGGYPTDSLKNPKGQGLSRATAPRRRGGDVLRYTPFGLALLSESSGAGSHRNCRIEIKPGRTSRCIGGGIE